MFYPDDDFYYTSKAGHELHDMVVSILSEPDIGWSFNYTTPGDKRFVLWSDAGRLAVTRARITHEQPENMLELWFHRAMVDRAELRIRIPWWQAMPDAEDIEVVNHVLIGIHKGLSPYSALRQTKEGGLTVRPMPIMVGVTDKPKDVMGVLYSNGVFVTPDNLINQDDIFCTAMYHDEEAGEWRYEDRDAFILDVKPYELLAVCAEQSKVNAIRNDRQTGTPASTNLGRRAYDALKAMA